MKTLFRLSQLPFRCIERRQTDGGDRDRILALEEIGQNLAPFIASIRGDVWYWASVARDSIVPAASRALKYGSASAPRPVAM